LPGTKKADQARRLAAGVLEVKKIDSVVFPTFKKRIGQDMLLAAIVRRFEFGILLYPVVFAVPWNRYTIEASHQDVMALATKFSCIDAVNP
jgi:hypothetical protein